MLESVSFSQGKCSPEDFIFVFTLLYIRVSLGLCTFLYAIGEQGDHLFILSFADHEGFGL